MSLRQFEIDPNYSSDACIDQPDALALHCCEQRNFVFQTFLRRGCFFLFKEREVVGSFPAIVAAGAGALLALIFSLLDLRNKQLYGVSKEALGLIEEQFLFALYRPLKISGSNYPSVITTEAQRYGHNNLLKHSLLMGGVYWLTLLMFLVLARLLRCGAARLHLSCQCRALHQRLTSKWTFRDYTLALRDAIYKRSQFCSH